jgi:hypothetical protein
LQLDVLLVSRHREGEAQLGDAQTSPRHRQRRRHGAVGAAEFPNLPRYIEHLQVANRRDGLVLRLEDPPPLESIDRRPGVVVGRQGQKLSLQEDRLAAVDRHRHHLGGRRVDELPLLIELAECHFAARAGGALLAGFHGSAVEKRPVAAAEILELPGVAAVAQERVLGRNVTLVQQQRAHRTAANEMLGFKKLRMPRARAPDGSHGYSSLPIIAEEAIVAQGWARHRGNVSALIAEMTEAAVRHAAFERAWQWYGGEEPSNAARAKVDAELEEGWALARQHAGKGPRRKTAA